MRAVTVFAVSYTHLLYEMCYTNILTVLELSGIPFLASERGEDMPLIACLLYTSRCV